MSLVPVFKIGLLNAWILMVITIAPMIFLPLVMNNEKMNKRSEGEPEGDQLSKTSRTALIITHWILMPIALIYSVFLPLQIGTVWLYIGSAVCLIAFVMSFLSIHSFLTAPLGEPMAKGIYAFSRHPAYFSFFLLCGGIGIACCSWIFLLMAAIWLVTWHFGVNEEEQMLLEKYGEAYRKYQDKTPRWIGIPKSDK